MLCGVCVAVEPDPITDVDVAQEKLRPLLDLQLVTCKECGSPKGLARDLKSGGLEPKYQTLLQLAHTGGFP